MCVCKKKGGERRGGLGEGGKREIEGGRGEEKGREREIGEEEVIV